MWPAARGRHIPYRRLLGVFLLALTLLGSLEGRQTPARPSAPRGSAPPGLSGTGPATPSSSSAPASGPATNPATFKVASFNILYTNPDLKAIVATIRQADADVLCLQETNDQSAQFLGEQLAKAYPYRTFQGDRGAGGLGILSKVPLRSVRHLPPKFGWFGTYVCEANLAGRAVQIVDAHLFPTIPPQDANLLAFLRAWQQAEATRAKEIPYIFENAATKLPRMVAGDLNSQPDGNVPQFLKDKGLIDSLASVRKDHQSVTTCKETFRGVTMSFRLDYVFHTKELAATDCQVLPTPASDHALVVTTLRWAPPASQPARTH